MSGSMYVSDLGLLTSSAQNCSLFVGFLPAGKLTSLLTVIGAALTFS